MESAPLVPSDRPNPRLRSYQTLVYFMTFTAYVMSHFSRKSYTTVKKSLRTEGGFSVDLLSRLDTGFMFAYAIGSFFSGSLGDKYNPVTVISIGLWGAGVCVSLMVVGVVYDFLSIDALWANVFFLSNWIVHGLFQSTGGPVNTAIMGNWFGAKNRGLIFGTWTCHQYMGNILAAIVATAILSNDIPYVWALLVPAIANAIWGTMCMCFLPARPSDVDVDPPADLVQAKPAAGQNLPAPIGFFQAFKIPAVAMYAFAFGFFKLVNYVLFFWLPYFLSRSFTPSQGNVIATLYDVGMMPGGIIVGFVSDLYGGRRACVIVSFLLLLCPLLYVFSQYSDVMPVTLLLVMLGFMGILVGGPNNIISSAVAADLASHPSIAGNSRALGTVTGIINGSGSITAALGLLLIAPMQEAWGWTSVWYFLILSTVIGCGLLVPKVMKELFDHDSEVVPVPATKKGYQAVEKA